MQGARDPGATIGAAKRSCTAVPVSWSARMAGVGASPNRSFAEVKAMPEPDPSAIRVAPPTFGSAPADLKGPDRPSFATSATSTIVNPRGPVWRPDLDLGLTPRSARPCYGLSTARPDPTEGRSQYRPSCACKRSRLRVSPAEQEY